MPQRKGCTACGVSKDETAEQFYPHPECRGGLDTACRSCRNAQRNAWRKRNQERLSARRRERYAEQNGARHKALEIARRERVPFRVTAENLLAGIWARSRKASLFVAPELRTKVYIEAWLRRQSRCACCSAEFDLGRKSGTATDKSPSFDRFKLDEGYTIAKTSLICWRCNNIKRNYCSSDLRLVAEWMDNRSKHEVGKFDEVAA